MKEDRQIRWALFGGAGFIGQHLAHSIINGNPTHEVHIFDIRSLEEAGVKAPIGPYVRNGSLSVLKLDVRRKEQLESIPIKPDVIINLAAIHREPGHKEQEYFETNVTGAQNICRFAESSECSEIVFTSSIAVYGVHDRPLSESSTPHPNTPYGRSKLRAEAIQHEWAQRTSGNLIIIRPGVVFGPGENGNVSRLVSESLKRQRAILIKPDQAKAGIYVKELVNVIHWLRAQPRLPGSVKLANAVSNERLTFNSHGKALQCLQSYTKRPISVSSKLIRMVTTALTPLGWAIPARSKFHPRRLAKISLPNDVSPNTLEAMGYPFRWPLSRALPHWLEHGL